MSLIGASVEGAWIISQHNDENPILAKLGVKQNGAIIGITTSFELTPGEEVLARYKEFMSEHEGEDWILKAKIDGVGKEVIIKSI